MAKKMGRTLQMAEPVRMADKIKRIRTTAAFQEMEEVEVVEDTEVRDPSKMEEDREAHLVVVVE